jgi:transcriptional antiterminator Rof (Rho-off)
MNYFLNQIKLKLVKYFPSLRKYLKTNTGFIKEQLKATDYTLGSNQLSKKVLQPDGNWEAFLPPPERQSGRGVETMACVTYSFLNVLETLFKRKYNIDINFSDRFLAKADGTTQNGNVQSRVVDTARKTGLVLESDYPSDLDNFSWNEYYKALTKDLLMKAQAFLNDYEIGYEAVPVTINAMREALKYSPLWVAGYAWSSVGGIYYSNGNPNHCFVLSSIEQAITFKHAYDTYDPYNKKLASQYQLYYPKLITLNKKGETFNSSEIRNLMSRGFTYILRVLGNGEIYRLDTDKLTYISPEEWNTLNVQMAADSRKLIGINEEVYQKLLV